MSLNWGRHGTILYLKSEAAACVPVDNCTPPEYLVIFNRHVAHKAPSSTRVEEKLSQMAYFKAKSIIGCPSGTLVILKAPGISSRTPLVRDRAITEVQHSQCGGGGLKLQV
ncbi:hypothetical protein TWF706_000042 [Orbilia oligospora]|nr:hypothetical protein TWF706_000042 [Orbilia oligospora]